jgi:hypothetical protein
VIFLTGSKSASNSTFFKTHSEILQKKFGVEGSNLNNYATEAIYCGPTENSRHLETQLVSKDALFKKEKESARRTARCHVSLEKSSKNYIRCESEPSQAAIHSVPPTSRPKSKLRGRVFPRGEGKCASWRRRGNSPWRLAT